MTRSKLRMGGPCVFAMGLLLLCVLPLLAEDTSSPRPTLNQASAFGVSAPLSELASQPQPPPFGFHEANPVRRIPKQTFERVTDPVEQRIVAPAAEFSLINHGFGVGHGFPNYTVPDAPPDTNMAVGDTQIIQWVNVSYTICNKDLSGCSAAILGNSLWVSGLPGSLCAQDNDGDILAQWDRAAHRWVLSQNVFRSPYAVCIAISQTPNAMGAWNVYQFPVPGNGFPDYPKMGIWSTGGASDGYFEAVNNFGPQAQRFMGPQICGYHRAKLLAGDRTAEQICFQLTASEDSLLPADVDSPASPPSDEDEFFIGSVADVDTSHLSLYSMHINSWATGSATMTGSPNTQLIAVAPYNGSCSGSFGGACVPQRGTGDRVDSLGDRLMYRFAYWKDSNPGPIPCSTCQSQPFFQHWFVNGDVESSTGQIGVRWYELKDQVTTVTAAHLAATTPANQGTYIGVPGDANYRWMGSLTRDKMGNILLGYSESSSTMYPSIAVAGRFPSDPVNTLSPEVFAVNGTGSQADTSNRWGDYSAMRVDPSDNCTFYYTTEYYLVPADTFDWSTDISRWKFSNCH